MAIYPIYEAVRESDGTIQLAYLALFVSVFMSYRYDHALPSYIASSVLTLGTSLTLAIRLYIFTSRAIQSVYIIPVLACLCFFAVTSILVGLNPRSMHFVKAHMGMTMASLWTMALAIYCATIARQVMDTKVWLRQVCNRTVLTLHRF